MLCKSYGEIELTTITDSMLLDCLEASKYVGNSPEILKGYIHANKQRLRTTYNKVEHLNVFSTKV